MDKILPALSHILCDPDTREPVSFKDNHFHTESGRIFPVHNGIANFQPKHKPFTHRFWEWVYNRSAFSYDFGVRFAWQFAFGGAPISRESYLPLLDIKPGARVLETACGTGGNILRLNKEAEFVGLDQSIKMLKRCGRKLDQQGRSATLIAADMAALPFKANQFDCVFHVGGLQFMREPVLGASEMYRVAKPGAEITIIDESASIKRMLQRSRIRHIKELLPAESGTVETSSISNGELFRIRHIKQK